MKSKTTPKTRNGSKSQNSTNSDAQASKNYLLKMIKSLNKTVEKLSKQLEEAMEQRENSEGKIQVPAETPSPRGNTKSATSHVRNPLPGEAGSSLPSKRPHPAGRVTTRPLGKRPTSQRPYHHAPPIPRVKPRPGRWALPNIQGTKPKSTARKDPKPPFTSQRKS